MLRRMKNFIADRKGAFAIQFALMVVPLTVCTGLAVDGGRAFLARYELEEALDAAALAVGSTLDETADLDAIAAAWVDKNFRTPHPQKIDLTVDVNGDVISLTGSVKINTYFMPLMGRNSVTVSAASEARRGGANVEVALALDVTQSMSGTKIAALQQAAKDLVAEVVNAQQSPFFSRVAIAPWGTNLHVGAIAPNLRGTAAGTTPITLAHWRDGAAQAITRGNWRVNAALTGVTATWRTGSEFTISTIAKSSTRMVITVSGSPGTLVNGDVVGIYTPTSGSTDGGFATYKNKAYILADKSAASPWTFNLKDMTGAYVSLSGTPANATSWRIQECLNTACQMRLTYSTNTTLANGDYVHLSSFTAPYANLNNTFGSPWQVTSTPTAVSNTAACINVVGPTRGNPNSTTSAATSGQIDECYTSTCEYAITAANHGFANTDRIYIAGTTATTTGGGATDIDNTTGNTWLIGDVTTNTFTLPGAGNSYQIWTASGTASECFTSNCQVKITSAAHGLLANDYVQIASVGGFTGANNSAAQVASSPTPTTNDFYLPGWGPSLGTANYTSNTGTAQCLKTGCQVYRFLGADSSYHVSAMSNCVTERTGTNATTDVAPVAGNPATWLGRDYPGAGSLVVCQTANSLTPLTHDTAKLNTAIDNLTVTGSTSGQIGAAWGWYMLSDKWAGYFPGADHVPVSKTSPMLSRVMVLMTDGAFNTAHCNGVTTETYAYSSVATSDRIDNTVCTASDTPFNQAQAICTAIKADKIVVYTVGFQVGAEVGAEAFLRACATDDSKAYIAANATELKDAFKAIGKEISKLRLSK